MMEEIFTVLKKWKKLAWNITVLEDKNDTYAVKGST